MKGSSKHGIFQVFSFFGMCALMCGAFIGLLISSGWLALLAGEGRQKTFLLPLLTVFGVAFWAYKKTQCGNKALHIIFYVTMSLIVSVLLMLYVFIPWWLPGYEGGPLLP